MSGALGTLNGCGESLFTDKGEVITANSSNLLGKCAVNTKNTGADNINELLTES
jgi:hypothetical protein